MEYLTGAGQVNTLSRVYADWQRRRQGFNAERLLKIRLAYTKSLSSDYTTARGEFQVDLASGAVQVRVDDLPQQRDYRVWLLDQNPNDGKGQQLDLGPLTRHGRQSVLLAQLNRERLQGFELDRVIVAPDTERPDESGLLYGTSGFLQRLHVARQAEPSVRLGYAMPAAPKNDAAPFSFLLPKVAHAAEDEVLEQHLLRQIARGRDLFFNETFSGNGRTCGTCHREDNNHTLDPLFIAGLPDDDPLFVHEYNPQLTELEDPRLLRQLGLVKAHLDGFERPAVFRAVSHTLSLGMSITPEGPEKDPDVQDFVHMLGWSGDGGSGDGSLRLFTEGAVIQHMPKTLNRVAGRDFRLPTEEELDAIEAYLLSLGQPEAFDLEAMVFSSPIVEQGKILFNTKDSDEQPTTGTGECKGCHFNGGGNSSSSKANGIRNTGVEDLPHSLAAMLKPDLPVDGGFGRVERQDCGFDAEQTCYGNKKFNMVTAFQVDTAPFFHNNSANTIEEAVAFYNTDAFNQADDRGIHMETSTVVAISLFLRTLGAIENIRSSNQLDRQVARLSRHDGREALDLAIAETSDAIELLEQGQLNVNPAALARLRLARRMEKRARYAFSRRFRNRSVAKAMALKAEARDLMVVM